jgi:tetratricopeptide (TPR) repeat protein
MLRSTLRALLCCGIFIASAWSASAADDFVTRAEQEFRAAMTSWRTNSASITAAVEVARAAFLWADFPMPDERREELAQKGIEAARRAISGDPNNAAARYWLALNQGQLARTKMLGALPLVKDMARELLHARDLDEHVDYAGPDRALGLLYRDAPGWPTSVGEKKRARIHLERAVKLHPEFPENQLCLVETYEKWGERNAFEQQLKTTERIVSEAHDKFKGPAWDYTWADWERRLSEMKKGSSHVGRTTDSKGVPRTGEKR